MLYRLSYMLDHVASFQTLTHLKETLNWRENVSLKKPNQLLR
ncbi:MAG: hypothetical protein NZM06_11740 [Chloroherpetonaceae bacterium]|nr:hypothetical protein [Chloroherpetonaceae bacterium]